MTHANLVRWEPFLRDLGVLADRSAPRSVSYASPRTDFPDWYPPVDIYDNGSALVLEAELPGFTRDAIDIHLDNEILTLSGGKSGNANGSDEPRYVRRERCAGSFARSFAIPRTVDRERIEAAYREGILTVTLPWSEASRPRRIDVKTR